MKRRGYELVTSQIKSGEAQMFSRHENDFSHYTHTPPDLIKHVRPLLYVGPDIYMETQDGWKSAKTLTSKDSVASLDGGFAKILAVHRVHTRQKSIFVPAGTLGSCADMFLPAHARVVLSAPPGLETMDAPFVSGCISDMIGYRGIRATMFGLRNTLAFEFEDEEIIWAQTGLMLHAHSVGDGFYRSLDYGETRAILALIDHSGCGPDLSDTVTVTKYVT
ncbi:MAG: hypothetical protein ABJQ34_16615 [Paracoccaceae bacterium]